MEVLSLGLNNLDFEDLATFEILTDRNRRVHLEHGQRVTDELVDIKDRALYLFKYTKWCNIQMDQGNEDAEISWGLMFSGLLILSIINRKLHELNENSNFKN